MGYASGSVPLNLQRILNPANAPEGPVGDFQTPMDCRTPKDVSGAGLHSKIELTLIRSHRKFIIQNHDPSANSTDNPVSEQFSGSKSDALLG